MRWRHSDEKGSLEMEENKKKFSEEKWEKRTLKEHPSEREKIAIAILFQFWKNVGGKDARIWKGISQARSVR